MPKFIIAAVALLAVAGGLTYWTLGRGGDSAEAEVKVVRWGNLTVQLSEETGVVPVRTYALTADGQPVLVLKRGDSFVMLDAETGVVVQENVADADRDGIQETLVTLEVSEQDGTTAPWPYSGDPPAMARERLGNITYIPPDPASGITVFPQFGGGPGGSGVALVVTNGRSTIGIDAETNVLFEETSDVLPEDKEMFDRFLSAVEYVEP